MEEELKLDTLLQSSPVLRIAHKLKEELITIYNSNITPSGGMKKIKKWLISAQIILKNAATTLKSHLEGICNYFQNRTTIANDQTQSNRSIIPTGYKDAPQ